MDGVYDPGARVHSCIPLLPHHPLLPVWAQRGPHRSARGPHHHHPTHRPCAALHLFCGLLHPAAKSTDRHDEWHTLEGGPGERRALEDSGKIKSYQGRETPHHHGPVCYYDVTALLMLCRWWLQHWCWRGGCPAACGLDSGCVGSTTVWGSAGISGKTIQQ